MDNQLLQKEVFRKLDVIIRLSDMINREVSRKILAKSQLLSIELTQDLKEKCSYYLAEPLERTQFFCKFCGRSFDDGRKLGGHVSRAHKTSPKKESSLKGGKKIRKNRRRNEEDQDSEAESSNQNVKIEEQ